MIVYVWLQATAVKGHDHTFTLNVPSVQRATDAVPKLLERHLREQHANCPLDQWTVWTAHQTTRLPRIHARGAIEDGTAKPPNGRHNHLAD